MFLWGKWVFCGQSQDKQHIREKEEREREEREKERERERRGERERELWTGIRSEMYISLDFYIIWLEVQKTGLISKL